jgi:hypothetical protein
MRFHHEVRYDAAPADVYAMLTDPDFRRAVCRAQHADGSEVAVEPADGGISVTVDQRRPTEGAPGFARAFVGDHIRIVQTEHWTGPDAARLAVDTPGKPSRMEGRITLAAAGAGSVQTVEGDLRVTVPLMGSRLEALVADVLVQALEVEARTGREWLAAGR